MGKWSRELFLIKICWCLQEASQCKAMFQGLKIFCLNLLGIQLNLCFHTNDLSGDWRVRIQHLVVPTLVPDPAGGHKTTENKWIC